MKTSGIRKQGTFQTLGVKKVKKKYIKCNVKWVLTDYMFNKVHPSMT